MKRSKFSLSHYKMSTMEMGTLVPIGLTEVLPGDTIQHATSAFVRVSPLNSPVMHPVHARIHHWFVPHRLVWEDWEDFITGGPDGLDASVFPTITFATGPAVGTLSDHLGVPTGINNIEVSALPYRGYALIWNEWYRDQDLQTLLTIDETSGADTTTNTTLQNVCWEKDYFTTARPWTQKGAEVTLPLGTTAPVERVANAASWDAYITGTQTLITGSGDVTVSGGNLNAATHGDISLDPNGGLQADLTGASAATINEIRLAFALQRYEEARARYGSRYTEYLRYLGVRSSDARLQRPEYLGGGKQTIQFSEVLQTAPTTGGSTDGVGEMLGHGIGAMRSNRYRRFFEEHGYVFSFISTRPIAVYANGLQRHWNRRTKEDFFQKELQHIGQMAILNKEVYAAHATPDGTFGYQDRYDEYRRGWSSISGEFRTTLDYWHYARLFSSDPALNSTFVASQPTDRVYQSTATDQLYVMANHSIQARRLVDKNGMPGMRIL